jgi:catechol-2,3-dioxygenase
MAMEIGHVHIKTYDPKKTAQFYIDNFGATMKNEAPKRQYPAQPARAAAQRHHH